MALDDNIQDIHRVGGIRGTGTGYVFPRVRLTRKGRRREAAEEETGEERQKQEPESSDGKKHIDVTA
ncbi:MAG TPA: hypothetical protein VK445_00735 [Dissulfurispiraceae bacterium]|nr:hypothetical protein [Dissulfurispiraceae bacterium]